MRSNQEMEKFFGRARTGLLGVQNDGDAAVLMGNYGYDDARVEELIALLDNAEEAYRNQKTRYSGQYAATHEHTGKQASLRRKLTRHRRIARVKIDAENPAYSALNLDGSTPRTHDGVIQDAKQFYNALLERTDLLEQLAPLTLDASAVELALVEIENLELSRALQTVDTKRAQEATATRNDLYDQLRDEMIEFYEVARIATEERPQVREAMGLVAPS